MTRANKNRRKRRAKKPKRAPMRTLRARPKARSSPKIAAGQCARQAAKSADAEIDRERQELYTAIEREWTPGVQKAVLNFARKRVDMMANAGIPIERSHAEHVVADALSDTALGRVHWKHRTFELKAHLFGIVRSRTAKILSRAKRFRHCGIGSRDSDAIEQQASMAVGEPGPYEELAKAQNSKRRFEHLLRLCRERSDITASDVLTHLIMGCSRRSEVATMLGISLREYDRARERIVERAQRLEDLDATE